jgi:Ca2+/H+ antiporter, TMEM165/GDT1 family
MDLLPLVSAFFVILVGELGDKTQLAAISLAVKYRARYVFAGAMLAFLVVDGVSVFISGSLLTYLPKNLIQIASGIVFIFFGVLPWLRKEKESERQSKTSRFPVFASFSLVALMEIGDKTQFLSISLTAETGAPLQVLVGIMLAFTVLTAIAVTLGCKVVARLPMHWLKIGTSALFIILGTISIVSGILGISIL